MKFKKKYITKPLRILGYVLIGIIGFVIILGVLIQTAPVQRYAKNKALAYLRAKIDTKIEMQTLRLSLWSGLTIEKFYAEDKAGDTLLYVKTLRVFPKLRAIYKGDLSFRTFHADMLRANLYEVSPGVLNFQYIADAFASSETDTVESSAAFSMDCARISVENSEFRYRTFNAADSAAGMDFDNLKLSDLNLHAKNLQLFDDVIQLSLDSLKVKEKSGFELKKLAGDTIRYDNSQVYLTDLLINTNLSKLEFNKIQLAYESPKAFGNFIDSVQMHIDAKDSSYFNLNDLVYFTDAISGLHNTLSLSGKINGTVSNLQTRGLHIGLDDIVLLDIDSDVTNLPNADDLQFNVVVNSLKINVSDLKTLKMRGDTALMPDLPAELDNISKLSYEGNTRGETSDFVSDGVIDTNIGKLTLTLTARKDSASIFALEGLLKANELEMSKIIGDRNFGKVSFFQNLKFDYTKQKKIKLHTEGKIDSLFYKSFNYQNVSIYADMNDMRIDSASVIIDRPNVKAGITAKADFNKQIPEIEFNTYADTLNLKAMNIEPEFRKSLLRFAIQGKFRGITLEDFEGDIHFKKPFRYQNDTLNLSIDSLTLTGKTLADNQKEIKLLSDVFDAKIYQTGKLGVLTDKLESELAELLPSFFPKPDSAIQTVDSQTEQLSFELNLKKTQVLADFIYPGLRISRNSTLQGSYVPRTDSLNLRADIGAILLDGIHLDSVTVRSSTLNGKFRTLFYVKKIQPADDMFFKNLYLKTQIQNDSIAYNITWNNKDSVLYKADIKGLLSFMKYPNSENFEMRNRILPSEVIIEDSLWRVDESDMVLDTMLLTINKLHLHRNTQHIRFDGSVLMSDIENSGISDISELIFENFEIANLQPLLGDDVKISGKLSGNTRIIQPLTQPLLFAENKINNLIVNDINLGKLILKTSWQAAEDKIGLNLFVEQGNDSIGNVVKVIETVGYYKPENDSIRLTTTLQALKANAFKSYFQDYVQMSRSTQLEGKINLWGTTEKWNIDGFANIKSLLVYVQELNTQYNSTEGDVTVKFDNHKIELLPAKLSSGKRNEKAEIQGIIKHDNFDKMITDFKFNFDNFQLYNTQATDTAYFYGTVHGTGDMKISGPVDDLKITGNIETGKNTRIFIPLSASESLDEETGFISFVTPTVYEDEFSKTAENSEYTSGLWGMTIDLDIKVTPDAEIQLIMDQRTGSVIKVRGASDMKVNMDTRGDITTFGDLIIEKGKYNFSLEGVINKEFNVEKGSKISLHGNPEEDIEMDLRTIYTLRKVPVLSLMAEEQYSGVNSTASCIVTMKGNMMTPEVAFDVELTDTDEDIVRQIRNLDEENRNVQFLSLLMIGKFQPLPGFSQEVVGGSVVNTGDVLTAQLNRLLSDVSENFDFGVNYAQGDLVSSDEIELALSTNLWDDRITINGNVGVGGQARDAAAENSGNVVGEVEAELKLNRQGTLKMKMYNRANDDLEYDKAPYTQGLGLFWRKQFDTLNIFKHTEDSVQNRK